MLRVLAATFVLCMPLAVSFAQGQKAATASQQQTGADDIDIVGVGRRSGSGASPKIPPRCVKRPGDPADLVEVVKSTTTKQVIAPDRKGVLALRPDREQVLGPDVWARAGTGVGQYVFRVPDDGTPLCIGAAVARPDGYGQLRRILRTTKEMRGRYVHFSTLVAARDAKLIRFWAAVGGKGARVIGGDTHTAPLHGTFGWLQADIIVGPVPSFGDHISYGFLLWGKGDVWVLDPHIEIKTLEEVRKIPTLPVTLMAPPGEQSHNPYG